MNPASLFDQFTQKKLRVKYVLPGMADGKVNRKTSYITLPGSQTNLFFPIRNRYSIPSSC